MWGVFPILVLKMGGASQISIPEVGGPRNNLISGGWEADGNLAEKLTLPRVAYIRACCYDLSGGTRMKNR